MKEYVYNQFHIVRQDNNIIISDCMGNEKNRIVLKPDINNLGKINIPLSNMCTMKCKYCSEAEYIRKKNYITSEKDAFIVINTYLSYIAKNTNINQIMLSFDYGGEPVCQINLLEKISSHFRNECKKNGKKSIVQMTTNAAWDSNLISRVISAVDEIIVSIDGYKDLQEKYRIHKSGNSVFDSILNNAKRIYKSGKLKQISSVITMDTVINEDKYISFLSNNFPGVAVKMNSVIVAGDAKTNNIERIPFSSWTEFMKKARVLSNGKLEILDSKPEKSLTTLYKYGCEHMKMTNWFYWLDGKITCCTDRETEIYVIGCVKNNDIIMDYDTMNYFIIESCVDNIQRCKYCIAKYYCAGGCPSFSEKKINCNRRLEKYAKLLIKR